MEDLLEFLEAAANWASIPLGLVILVLATAGAGLWKPRWRRTLWAVSVVLVVLSFYFGVSRGEWGETLFNGQLL